MNKLIYWLLLLKQKFREIAKLCSIIFFCNKKNFVKSEFKNSRSRITPIKYFDFPLIGMHHAGLVEKDRQVVEELFVNQKIQVLIATATVAWGVNFPAHLVVVKGTEYFDPKQKRYVDMPITDVLQMMGRAGRPQVNFLIYIIYFKNSSNHTRRISNKIIIFIFSSMIMAWPVSWCTMSKNIFTKNFCTSLSQWNPVCCKYCQIIWTLKSLLEPSQRSKKLWITWHGRFSSGGWCKIQLIMV